MSVVRALMIGDIVGEGGLLVLERLLPGLIAEYAADFVVVNGENAAGGFGMTEETLSRILAAGADAVTSGNHVWEKRDFWPLLENEARMLRPANYPEGTPGRGVLHTEKAGVSWAVINLQGREQMVPIDCPFRALDALVQRVNAVSGDANYGDASYGDAVSGKKPIILVDFHAESAREKEALGYFIDGRASLVAGTHTHVQTADERVLPRGSAYITDLGMTGVCGGVIGMDAQICLDRARTQILYRMEPARPDGENGGQSAVMGVAAEIDGDTGRALSVTRVFRRAPSA